jgi:hypothetical protein
MADAEGILPAWERKRATMCNSGYQTFSADYEHRGAKFEAVNIAGPVLAIFRMSINQINNWCMERGGNPGKREGRRLAKGEIRKFFDREFDWIALLLITVIILLSLVFF